MRHWPIQPRSFPQCQINQENAISREPLRCPKVPVMTLLLYHKESNGLRTFDLQSCQNNSVMGYKKQVPRHPKILDTNILKVKKSGNLDGKAL